METLKYNIPVCFVMVSVLLCVAISVHGAKAYFDSVQEVACQQAKKQYCGERIISGIAAACTNLGQEDDKADLGHKCSRNDECRVKESVCFEGVCLCTPGLYYNPGQNTCVRECAEYGDQMDVYPGAGIVDHNDKSVNFVTQSGCIEACVKERSFTCLTLDLKSIFCTISKSGYLDVKEKDREINLPEWIFAQRRCK